MSLTKTWDQSKSIIIIELRCLFVICCDGLLLICATIGDWGGWFPHLWFPSLVLLSVPRFGFQGYLKGIFEKK